MKRNIIILFWVTSLNISFGQNLINNSSFELAKADSPDVAKTWDYFTCNDWFTATTGGSPDYFTAKRIGYYGVPNNLWGKRDAHSGIAYAGFGLSADKSGLFEYLEIKLNQKLIKNTNYCLSLYLSPSDITKFTTNEIDYYLSSDKQEYKTSNVIKISSFEKFVASKGYFEENEWYNIQSCYRAKGGEEYLTIGCLNENPSIIPVNGGSTSYKLIYYYIDDVSLIPILNESGCKCNELTVYKSEVTDYSLAKDQPIIIQNINFETNKSQLLSDSETELYKLSNYLRTNSSFKAEIIGYTDNVGKEAENIVLSKSRAKAVADFLISTGVSKDKIVFKGLGSKFPIKPNDTEENKKINRRVEFKIIK